jgi:hypothetical protein
MLKTVYILLVFLVFSISTAQAQATQEFVTYSPSLSIPRSENIMELILVEDSLPAVITQYGNALLLRRFFGEFKERPELLFGKTNKTLLGYHRNGNTLIIFSENKFDSNFNYSLLEVMLTKDSLIKKAETHFNLSKNSSQPNKNNVILKASPDGGSILVGQQDAFKSGKRASINFFLLNHDTSFSYSLPLGFDGDDASLLGAAIDNGGTLYFALKTGVKLNSPFRKKHMIYAFDANKLVLVEFDMSSTDFFLQEMLIETADSGVIISSIYSGDPLIEEKSNGYSFVNTTNDGRDIKTRLGGKFSSSAIEVHNEFEPEGGNYISDLFLNQTVLIGNQRYLVFEKRYQDQICNADPSTGIVTCTDQFHYSGLSFENPLHPEKSITLRRKQVDYDRPGSFSGHCILPKDGFIWVFYNDHYKNQGTSAERVMNNVSRSIMRFVRVDAQGKLTSGMMSAERQTSFAFTPEAGMVQNDRMAYYVLRSGETYRIGKFDFSKLSALSKGFN